VDPSLISLLEQAPVAGAIVITVVMFLRYLKERDNLIGKQLENNTAAMSKLSEAIAHLEGKLDGG
jgi:hypothetical protein